MPRKKELNQSEKYITDYLYDQYSLAKINQSEDDTDFTATIDMLECRRTEKDYEWLSDVFLPEYASIHLTEAAQWVQQYFPTRDFVEVYLSGKSEISKKKSLAAKDYINAMLNVKDLYHYQKYVRVRSINSTRGCAYAVCSWKQKLKTVAKQVQQPGVVGYDDEGQPITKMINSTQEEKVPVIDRFQYEVIDPRNVFTDSKYVYSIQDKEWIAIRSEMSYEDLKSLEEDNGYINLDLLKDKPTDELTDTARETDERASNPKAKSQVKLYDVVEFFRKVWAVVKERDEDGNPVELDYGYNERGDIKQNAELVEAIVTIAYSGKKKVLIRHQATPFITSLGLPYRPIIRALCYIHPTKDIGISDGKYGRELQALINDMINMGIDRSKLSMMPTLKVRRIAWDDNDSIYFEPEHSMVVENPDDITEFKIDGNIDPAMSIVGIAKNSLQQLESIYPTTMGELPGKASTTATAVAGAESRTNLRTNYKSLTFEYTYLTDFYWQMLQMAYRFMHPTTAIKIMGDNAQYFDPEEDYNYQPVTSNIEAENSKKAKIQMYDQLIGRLSGMAQSIPQVIPIIAHMISEITKLMGNEYQDIGNMIDQFSQAQPKPEGGGEQPKDMKDDPTSNQSGNPMMQQEISARDNMNQGMI
jgi:hypothetical protein